MTDEYKGEDRRKSPDDLERIIVCAVEEATTRAITAHAKITPEVHVAHHNWTKKKIEKEQECSRRRKKVTDTMFGGIGISVILGTLALFGAFLRHLIMQWLDKGGN